MTAEECKHTLGRKGNVVYLDCDGIFTREQGPLTTETGGWKVKVLVASSSLNLCDPMGCSLPGSSVHGILQARILQGVVIPFPRGSSWPRNWTQVFCIVGRFFTIFTIYYSLLATREARDLVLFNYRPLYCIWHRQITQNLNWASKGIMGLWGSTCFNALIILN